MTTGNEQKSVQDPERLEIIRRIKEYERLGGENFFKDVENDPPYSEIKPEDVDYFCKKLTTKIKTCIAMKFSNAMQKQMSKDLKFKIEGFENLKDLKSGAVVTSNHFNQFENLIVKEVCDKAHKKLHKVIREGNFFIPGKIGFALKFCNTMPISQNKQTMLNFIRAVDFYLKKGDMILVYPEQAMWWNYRKPRLYQIGAYHFASKNNVPIVPCFVTMKDQDCLDEFGFAKQQYTIHVMPLIYPNKNKSIKENEVEMRDKNFQLCKNKYEEVYGKKLRYDED